MGIPILVKARSHSRISHKKNVAQPGFEKTSQTGSEIRAVSARIDVKRLWQSYGAVTIRLRPVRYVLMRSWDGGAMFVSTSSCAGLTRMCGGVGAVLARLIPFTHAYIRLGPMVVRPEKTGYGCATVLSRFDTVVLRLQQVATQCYIYIPWFYNLLHSRANSVIVNTNSKYGTSTPEPSHRASA